MLKLLLFFIVTLNCTHTPPKKSVDEDLVTVKTALDQAQFSYQLGCVEASKRAGINGSYEDCRDRSIIHRKGINEMMESP